MTVHTDSGFSKADKPACGTRVFEESFSYPIHPYTRNLPSVVPHPNPEVEKQRKSVAYGKDTNGIDYEQGMEHLVKGAHTVLATQEELGPVAENLNPGQTPLPQCRPQEGGVLLPI